MTPAVEPVEPAPVEETAGASLPAAATEARAPFWRTVAVHGAEDLRVRYWHVPEKLEHFEDRDILDYVESVERLDVSAGGASWTLAARVDAVALFANRYILDGELVHERDVTGAGLWTPLEDGYFNLEKLSFEHRGTVGTATVGDAYVSFGRGYVLNLVKNTEIDVDTSLRGARGVAHAGPWDVTVATGWTNPQQIALENPNLALQPGLRHAVTGLRVDRYGLGPVNLGVHGVAVQFERAYDTEAGPWMSYAQLPGAVVAGGTIEALGVGGLDLFAEVDGFRYDDDAIPVAGGHALYASVAAYPGALSILAEARRSFNAEYVNTYANNYEIGSGPTLEYERVITEDSAAAVNSNDLTGGRVRVDARLAEGAVVPYVALAGFRDEDLGSLHFNPTPETIGHAVAGVQWMRHETHVMANGGYRMDVRDAGDAGEDWGADRVVHADVDFSTPIGGPFTLELAPSVLRYAWGTNRVQQADFLDFSNTLAIKIGAPWSVIAYTDYSDNPLIRSTGNLSEHVYGALEVQWMPGPATTLKAFYGAYRAGIRCAGGQCRYLPGFEGAKLSVTTAF